MQMLRVRFPPEAWEVRPVRDMGTIINPEVVDPKKLSLAVLVGLDGHKEGHYQLLLGGSRFIEVKADVTDFLPDADLEGLQVYGQFRPADNIRSGSLTSSRTSLPSPTPSSKDRSPR